MATNNHAKDLLSILSLALFCVSMSRAQIGYPYFVSLPNNVNVREDIAVTTQVVNNIQINNTQSNTGLIVVTCLPAQSTPNTACDFFSLTAVQANQFVWVGFMTLQRALDYDVTRFYNISLRATDGTRTNYGYLGVTVVDVQNKPPRFTGNTDASVREITTPGSTVNIITYTAVDGDATNTRSIQYSLVSNPGALFAINSATGQLTNTGTLSYSDTRWSNGYIDLQVRATELISPGVPATDPLSFTTITSRITLVDANSNAPAFDRPSYSGTVVERSAAGTPVQNLNIVITDRDRSPFNSQFDITMDRFTDVFQVVPSNGTGSVSAQITVLDSTKINYDTGPREFSFTITARESRTQEHRSASAQVNISLVGVNNYPPVINPSVYNVSVSELAPGGTNIIKINATDDDYGNYGVQSIRYKLITPSNLFVIAQITNGLVTVKQCATPGRLTCIDYEKVPSYTLVVVAVDNYGEGFTASATINVGIINENDQVPAFTTQEYISQIQEGNQQLDTPIFINATDDYRNAINFNISSGDPQNLWRIESTSKQLLANRPINYDDTPGSQGYFLLTIMAWNTFGSSSATARIQVVPVNRHKPVFNNTYNRSIPDNTPAGTEVVQIVATDGDSPNTPNGQIRYRLASGTGDNFAVDPITGIVTVAPGARLTQSVYNITIVAEDRGTPQESGSGILVINITPSSSAPVFQSNPVRVYTLENAPVNTILGSSNVTDPDPNPVLVYDIIEPIFASARNGISVALNSTDRTMFAVNRTTGMIYVNRPLEFDHINMWQAIIRVIDQSATAGTAASSSTATLIVTIYSVNDKPPEFKYPWTPQTPTLNISRSQDTGPEVPVTKIEATSPNTTLVITYKLIDDYNGAFTINNVTGEVRLNRTLSYATDKDVKYVVVATDNGQPPLSSTATVYVTVENTNLYSPEFTQDSYYAEIPENSPGGTTVIKVMATDKDVGDFGTIRYTISSPSNMFLIDSVTGVITVANGAILDRETQPQIYLTVNAFDSPNNLANQKFTSAEVLVNLTDVNDNEPKFDRYSYIASIVTADVSTNYTIIRTIATDPDLGENGTVRYSITAGNTNNIFKIDPVTGDITPATSLLNNAGSYQLTVMANDLGTPVQLNSTAQVYINVQQASRQKPVWYKPSTDSTTINIREKQPIGTYVTDVYANTTSGGGITYWLQYYGALINATNDFAIDVKTGVITTQQPFDYDLQNNYLISLVAQDDFGQEANRFIIVNILKVDDTNPEFPTNNKTCCAISYDFTVDKVSPVNSVFGYVRATFPDHPYRAVYYRVLSADEGALSYFGVDQFTGQMKVNGSLQGTAVNQTYHMVIEAYHQQVHPFGSIVAPCQCNNKSRVDVFVHIVDNTRQVPTFSNNRYNICISESEQIGRSVFQANNTNYDKNRLAIYAMTSLSNSKKTPPEYDISNQQVLPVYMNNNGTVFTAAKMNAFLDSYFNMGAKAWFVGRSSQTDIGTFNVLMYIVQLKNEALITIKRPLDDVWADIDAYKSWITEVISRGTVCIQEVRHHISPEGAVNTDQTDILLYAIDGSNRVIPPLELDKMFDLNARAGKQIIGITEANNYWDGFNYIPVAAAIGIIIGLLVLALILFCCCCWFWSWLLKSARYTEKEPLIYNAGSLGVVNPVWNQKLFESQQLSMAVAEGDGMDKTIALHGAYNGYDAGDGDVFGQHQGDGTSRLNLQRSASPSGISRITEPGLVHIEAPLHDGYAGEASASTQRETTMTVESALQQAPAPTGGAASGGASSELNAMSYSDMPYNQTTGQPYANQTTTQTTTTTTSQMVHGYSTGTMTDVGDDDDGAAGGTVTRPNHSSYDAPVVELTGAGARGPAKIGATLYQPFGITGEQRPQSVISGRETYMNEEDYRGTMAGGYSADQRAGSRSAMSSLPLQKEIVFNDLRPESMYGVGEYENAGGYYRDSDGAAYQGEIRLGTMREPLGSSSDRVHETRYL